MDGSIRLYIIWVAVSAILLCVCGGCWMASRAQAKPAAAPTVAPTVKAKSAPPVAATATPRLVRSVIRPLNGSTPWASSEFETLPGTLVPGTGGLITYRVIPNTRTP